MYWEGKQHPIVELCIQTVVQNSGRIVRVLSYDKAVGMGYSPLLKLGEGMPSNFKTDPLRFALLHDHGGIWLDTDMICFKPLDWKKRIEEYDFVGVYNPHQKKGQAKGGMFSWAMGSNRGSRIAQMALDDSIRCFDTTGRVPWGDPSTGSISRVFRKSKEIPELNVYRYEHWQYSKINWWESQELWVDHPIKKYVNEKTKIQHLSNKVINHFKDMTRAEVLDSDTLVGRMFCKALGCPPP